MALQSSLDYTVKDFDALRDRLFNVIPSAFPEWTDRQVADFGNLLVELYAYVGDVLGFYQDNQAKESRWTSARLRRSLLSMIKLIGYVPPGAVAATTDLTVQLAASPIGSVTILAGDLFRTLDAVDPVVFQAVSTVVIPAHADPPTVIVPIENSLPGYDLVQSTELPNQEYTLGYSPYLDGSLSLVANNGSYTLVEDFLSSSASDRHATVTVDENDRATVRFGDGLSGAIPTGAIAFTYKTGGGSRGTVVAGAIAKADKSYTDSFGNPVTVIVTNLAKPSDGAERQTVEGIRSAAPRSVRAVTRTVAREDYEINALRVGGVARALMMTADEKTSVLENTGELYIVPNGGGTASNTLIDNVRTMITVNYPHTITFKPSIFSAKYLLVNVVARIHLKKGAVAGVVGPAVRKSLEAFFAISNPDGSANPQIDFGFYLDGALAWSDIFAVVRTTAGVRKIDDGLANLTLNGSADDVEVLPEEFPILGTVTVIDAVTGAAMP